MSNYQLAMINEEEPDGKSSTNDYLLKARWTSVDNYVRLLVKASARLEKERRNDQCSIAGVQ